MKQRLVRMLLGGAASIIAACGGSAGSSASSGKYFSCGLREQVALVGLGADHAVLLTPRNGQMLERSTVPVGKGAIIAKSSQDGRRLFVVSRGEEGVETPSLTVVDVTNAQAISSRRYELPALHSGMVIDPEGRWVALHTVLTLDYSGIDVESEAPAEVTGVKGETRNEILVVDVDALPSQAITSHVVDSPEVVPRRISFSPRLQLPGAAGRLLAVETDHDVSILDLEHVTASPPATPIVVAILDGGTRGSQDPTSPAATPVELLYDDGDPTRDDDARLVVRLAGSSKVSVLTFAPPGPPSWVTTGSPGFELVREDVVADGIVEHVELVGTTDGPRLALLVPSASAIELVDLNARSETSRVSLPHPYQSWANLRREGISDTLLLTDAVWTVASNSATGIWSPNPTEDAPYGHVETVQSLLAVRFLLHVPSPHDDLVLFGAGFYQGDPAFFVFNLRTGAVTRVEAVSPDAPMVSGDGRHLWFFATQPNSDGTSRRVVETVNLEGLGASAQPAVLEIEGAPGALFEVERSGGGRVMVEVAGQGGVHWGEPVHDGRGIVMVFDGDTPETSPPMTYRDLLRDP
jgi:hypothetical protein